MKVKRFLTTVLSLTMIIGLLTAFTITASAAEIVSSQPANGDGSADNPYQIGTAAELYWFAEQVNGGNTGICGELTADITLNENLESKLNITTTNNYTYGKATLKSGQSVNEWTAIGTETNPYAGTFDGGEYSIIGLYVNKTDSASKYNGLFGYVKNGTVRNVTVEDSYIAAYSHMGGVVGYLYEGKIENCHCNDTWMKSQSGYMGGVVGYVYSQNDSAASISDCTSSVVYYQYQYSGGIVGNAEKTTIDDCVFSGELMGISKYSGGIVGYLKDGSITDCVNIGTMKGGDYTGGIAGYSKGCDIINCTNNGAVTGGSDGRYIGGIVGEFDGNISSNINTIINCTNNCAVTQTGDKSTWNVSVGGVAGRASDVTITDCFNYGDISGVGSQLGGIVGTLSVSNNVMTVEKCGNYGNITGGSQHAGGIVGYLSYTSLIKDCYNVGTVNCVQYPGGIVGFVEGYVSAGSAKTSVITGCYSAASVSGTKGGAIAGQVNYYATVQDNYYDNTKFSGSDYGYKIGSGTITDNNGYTTEKFADGTVLALLNGNAAEEEKIWFQTIGAQATPEFTAVAVNDFEIAAYAQNEAKTDVTLLIPEAGTYSLFIADYEGNKLKCVEIITQSFDEGVVTVTSTKDFTLSTDDKIILWTNITELVPLCDAYTVK